ncbi:hypothetical protein HL666_14805 [Bradyrhizobium sp. 83002]|uniref:hypothetical protein n=1 Tax=Bradyrhizobium aeschynomenes TaxID=2734909 RepID=UPI0015573F8C|nr:hypothetical protein [Bradyrhizobium aeschynomenes]NPU12039.1 hypothetical protein [Bradyrhizobium aeschynomenes]
MNQKRGKRNGRISETNTRPAPARLDAGKGDRRTNDALPLDGRIIQPDRKHWLDYITALLGFIAAITGFGAAGFSGWQAWIAYQGTIVANRAFVLSNSFQYITYQEPTESNRIWIASPLIENSGNTQTRRMTTFTQGYVGLPGGFPWDDSTKQQPRANRLIGPKGSSVAQTVGATPESFNQMQSGPKLGAAGIIRYQDIFGGWHLTEYCYFARPMTHFDFKAFPSNQPVRAEGQLCDQHNCADEECGPDWLKRAME